MEETGKWSAAKRQWARRLIQHVQALLAELDAVLGESDGDGPHGNDHEQSPDEDSARRRA